MPVNLCAHRRNARFGRRPCGDRCAACVSICEHLPDVHASAMVLPPLLFPFLVSPFFPGLFWLSMVRYVPVLLLVLLTLCTPFAVAGGGELRPLRADEASRRLDGQIALLRDPGGQLTIDEVAAPSQQGRFVALTRDVAQGFTRGVVWLRIALQREVAAPAHWRLEAANAVIDDYRFYGPDDTGHQTLIMHAGDRQPFDARPCRYRHPLFPVTLPDAQQRVFYLRVESATAIVLALTLWQPEGFRVAVQSELMAIGLAFGVIASTVLMCFFGGALMRDRRYGVFIAACLFFGLFLATALGLTAQFAFADAPVIADALHKISICLYPAVVLLFMRQALRTPVAYPRLDAWLRWGGLASVVSTLCVPLGQFHIVGPVMQLAIVLSTTLFAWVSWLAQRAGRSGARGFLAGSLGLLLPTLWAVLVAQGAIDGAAWIETGLIVAVLSFCVLANMGLLLDFKAVYDERLCAAAEARLNRSLADQERRLRDEQARLFSWVAHELRNPLGFIVYGLSNLRTGLADSGDAVQQRIARLAKAARRMSDLIDRSVRLQRLAGVDYVPDFDSCSPGFPALEACARTADVHPGRAIDYVASSDLPAEVTVDAELVTLALANLLDNAVKYSPADAPITLSVDRDASHPGQIVYRVSDRGPGISDEDRQRLFGAQSRQAGKDSARFGIGLSLVAHVVRHHGGRVECVARAGGGTCCELCFPISRAKDSVQP